MRLDDVVEPDGDSLERYKNRKNKIFLDAMSGDIGSIDQAIRLYGEPLSPFHDEDAAKKLGNSKRFLKIGPRSSISSWCYKFVWSPVR